MKPVKVFLASLVLSLSLAIPGLCRADDPPAKPAPGTEKKSEAEKKPEAEQKPAAEKPVSETKPEAPADAKKREAKPDSKPAASTEEKSEDGVPMKSTKPANAAGDKKTDSKETKTEKKATPAPGGLFGIVGRMVGGQRPPYKAPETPEEAVEIGFNNVRRQSGMTVPDSTDKKEGEKKDADKKEGEQPASDPWAEEQKRWIEAVNAATPPDKFKALPQPRQQEILQLIQNSVWMVRDQRNPTQLSSKEYRDANLDVVTLRSKRLAGLPAINPEPRAEIEKQLQSMADIVVEKAKTIRPDLLKNEGVLNALKSTALNNLTAQMRQTSTLTFKIPLTAADIDKAKSQFEENLKQYERNKAQYMQDLNTNLGLNDFDKMKPEDQEKFLTLRAPMIGQNLFYQIFPFSQFIQSLQNNSRSTATKVKGASVDLTGGVSDKVMKEAERKLQRLQQREWRRPGTNQWGISGKTADELADNIVKQAATQFAGRGIIRIANSDKPPEVPKEQQKQLDNARDALKRILHEELSNEDFEKLHESRKGAITGHLVNLTHQLLNYGRFGEMPKEQADVAIKRAQIEVRKEAKIPVIPVEQREVTEKQVDQIINRLVDLTAKKEPDLFVSESVRESYRDALRDRFDQTLANTRDAAFKIPLSEVRFQQLLNQLDTKFRVYWTKNNRVNLIQPNEQASFKAMSKEEKIQFLDEQNRAINIGYNLSYLGNEVIQSVKLDYEMYARATKFSKIDFSGGVSKDEELQLHNLQATVYEKAQAKAAANAKKQDRSAAEAGKVRESAAAALLKPGLISEEAQHKRFMFFVNSSIGAAIVLLVMLLFKLRSNRLKKASGG